MSVQFFEDSSSVIRERVVEMLLSLSEADRNGWTTLGIADADVPGPLGVLFAWVSEMVVALGAEHEQGAAFRRELEEKLSTVERQRTAIRELSTPIIELWESVLCLPVVGVVDTVRSVDMTSTLLRAVVEKNARYTIVDITGIDVMDTRTVDHFVKMAKAVRLLGAQCALAGISPQIAQTVVSMGIDFSDVATHRTLRDALQGYVERTGGAG
jgi:rsbT co-antagonist protein RsbR